ncbi:MAG: hypothetical protein AABO41_01905 [Acidobacteriota bacterium]
MNKRPVRVWIAGLLFLAACNAKNESAPKDASTAKKDTPEAAEPAPATETGTASGTLTVKGQSVQLAYAYALRVPGMFDKTTQDVQVIVTDKPVPKEVVEGLRKLGKDLDDCFSKMTLSMRGLPEIEVQGMYLLIDAQKHILSRSPHHLALENTSISLGGGPGGEFTVEEDSITGKSADDNPSDEHPWSYTLTFKASLKKP